MKYTGPKIKKARRLGIMCHRSQNVIWNAAESAGTAWTKSSERPDYAQLTEKQWLRYQYNLSEKQLRGVYTKVPGSR